MNKYFDNAHRFLGIKCSQNEFALNTFHKLFKKIEENNKIERIIEIGTYFGGLSCFIGLFCYMNDKKFITYDIKNFITNPELLNTSEHLYEKNYIPKLHKIKNIFQLFNIDYRVKNIFEPDHIEEIKTEIEKEGTTIILCDGGDKIKEFNIFSNFMKPNDIIMAHDFCYSQEKFQNTIKNVYWNVCEITENDIAEACLKNNLMDCMKDEFNNAVWTCKRKIK